MACLHILQQHTWYCIIAIDADSNSPAKNFCDVFEIVPLTKDPSFWVTLQNLINKYSPSLILPSFENWFDICKNLDGNFITDFKRAILCKNKFLFYQTCLKLDLPIIETYLLENFEGNMFPMYIKPITWVGSRDNFSVETEEELKWIRTFLGKRSKDFIIQPLIKGRHRNVDVLMWEEGDFLNAITRLDIKQVWGNCITVELQNYDILKQFSKNVWERLQIKSPFNLEVFEVEKWKFIINEINVRFWWWIIFWAMSGMDFISFILTKDKKYIQNYNEATYSRYLKAIKI